MTEVVKNPAHVDSNGNFIIDLKLTNNTDQNRSVTVNPTANTITTSSPIDTTGMEEIEQTDGLIVSAIGNAIGTTGTSSDDAKEVGVFILAQGDQIS